MSFGLSSMPNQFCCYGYCQIQFFRRGNRACMNQISNPMYVCMNASIYLLIYLSIYLSITCKRCQGSISKLPVAEFLCNLSFNYMLDPIGIFHCPRNCYLTPSQKECDCSYSYYPICNLQGSPAQLPLSGHSPAPQCLYYSEGPKTKLKT